MIDAAGAHGHTDSIHVSHMPEIPEALAELGRIVCTLLFPVFVGDLQRESCRSEDHGDPPFQELIKPKG